MEWEPQNEQRGGVPGARSQPGAPLEDRPRRSRGVVGPGTLIDGRYEARRRIGKGGSAEVFRVIDLQDGVERALKLLTPRPGQVLAEARFRQEIRLCAGLRDPNLVRVHEAGAWEGLLYFTMDLLEGIDLREHLELAPGRSLEPVEAVGIALGVARGLVAVHEAGIVHRDIKPANIQLVPGPERVKLVDFGIAFALRVPLGLSSPDMVVGTPAYVSPERVLSSAAPTPQADLHSLGVILYELLAGERPFQAPSVAELFQCIASEPPPPLAERAPSVSAELVGLVECLLAKDPEDRPPGARALVRRLEALEGGGA